MKPFILAVPVVMLALSACGSDPVIRETVVERPVVKEKETIVERAVPSGAGATAPNCVWASQSYSNGAMTCQERVEYRCQSGMWERTVRSC